MFQTFEEQTAGNHAPDRMAALRDRLATLSLDAFLVPRGDQYRGEYVPPHAERLAWLTGFTGSAGFAAVTVHRAALFVDGRYTVQARNQVAGKLFEILLVPGHRLDDWLIGALPEGGVVGFDPSLHSLSEIEGLTTALRAHTIKLKAVGRNPIDRLWGQDQPAPPRTPVRIHPDSLAGASSADKLAEVQKVLNNAQQDAVVLTAPESINWLFNIRGSDVPHTPLALCFAVIPRRGKAELFLEAARLDADAKAHLKGVAKIIAPSKFGDSLTTLRQAGKKVRVAPEHCNWWIARRLGGGKKVARGADPCMRPKAIKTKAEIRGSKAAHIRDGAAMCRFLAWLDAEAPAGNVDEISAARQLETFRTATNMLEEISFDTISGSGPNGAIVHYRVTERTNRKLGPGELYLVDSGAQYRDATTDITRTVAIGTPTDEMRDRFTRVLKGHIAIATAVFPVGTRGIDLDPLARHALWQAGLDFNHGTGHGVGSYLSVHEGPQSISKRGMVELKPGMITSNEPGYYKEGAYGIRIENLILTLPPKKPKGGDQPMLSFETLTFTPIDRRLVDPGLLSQDERDWLNAYHARVLELIGPKLDGDDLKWLTDACQPIG